MVALPDIGTGASRALAVIRLTNGVLALVLPQMLVKRTSRDPSDTAPNYAFRMFGIRTLVLGADLLLVRGSALDRARNEAIIIHSSDTVCAAIGGRRNELSPRARPVTVAISAVNATLAILARAFAPKGRP